MSKDDFMNKTENELFWIVFVFHKKDSWITDESREKLRLCHSDSGIINYDFYDKCCKKSTCTIHNPSECPAIKQWEWLKSLTGISYKMKSKEIGRILLGERPVPYNTTLKTDIIHSTQYYALTNDEYNILYERMKDAVDIPPEVFNAWANGSRCTNHDYYSFEHGGSIVDMHISRQKRKEQCTGVCPYRDECPVMWYWNNIKKKLSNNYSI
jgi:hypothetical protein